MSARQPARQRNMWLLAVSHDRPPELIGQALRRKGDRALAVRSVHEAWHLLAQTPRQVTGVVVSLEFGAGNALELARDLQEDYPDIRIALMTRLDQAEEDFEFPVLVEPFSPEEVRLALMP